MEEYSVLLRKQVKVYSVLFQVELRKYRDDYFQLADVYDNCEHDRGFPYDNINDALCAFEGACGVKVSEEMRDYLMNTHQ